MRPIRSLLVFFSLLLVMAAPSASAAGESMVTNGGFETDENLDGYPDGWPEIDHASWESEGEGPEENRFVRITAEEPGQTIVFYKGVMLRGDPEVIEVSARVRTYDVEKGPANWHDARIVLHFIEKWGGEKLKPAPRAITFNKDTDGWVEVSQRIKVPEGARILEFMPAMFQVKSGRLDIDDVSITAVSAAKAAAAEAKEAALNPMPQKEPVPVIDDLYAGPLPPLLRAVGSELRTVDGNERVWLQGLNVPSLEWTPTGEAVLKSIRIAIDDWNANVIRLPVKGKHWFGQDDRQDDDGTAFRQLVDACIHTAASRGAYVVLDLHHYRAPRPQDLVFWQDAAARYRDHPAVLFGLFNEPHSTSWDVWRDGGVIEIKQKTGEPDAEAKVKERYLSPGMQGLLDTVRASGARNLVVVGGLDWAYDLSGVVQGYALDDAPHGLGIVYDTHIYHWKTDWRGKVLAAAERFPILVGEVGADTKKVDWLHGHIQEDPYTWVPDMLGLIQQHRLHWTGWSFHTKAWPRMLSNWHYEPTPFWGEFAKRALRGERFELEKMR